MDEEDNIIDFENTQIDTPKRIQLNFSQVFGFTKEHIDKIIQGFIPKAMEDKWFIYSKDNWIFFHRSWTGQGIYKAEIKYINGRYIIDDFYAERNVERYSNTDDLFDIHILHILIIWGLLCVDCRSLYLTLFNKTEDDFKKLWHILGSFLISSTEIEEYEFIKNAKLPCKEVFRIFNEKVEVFIGFLENLHYHKSIPASDFKKLLTNFRSLAAKMKELNVKIVLLMENDTDIAIILKNISKSYSFIFSNIESLQTQNLKYFKNDKRSFTFEKIISNLISNSNPIRVEEESINNIFSYKEIMSNKMFNAHQMFRIDC